MVDKLNLNQMLLFAKVAETGSFSETARQMGVGKSAVSMQISKLEKQMGVQLLYRTTRHINLTEAGEIYYQSCALIMQEAARANERVKLFKNEVSGYFKITCPIGFGNRILLPSLKPFFEQYPEVEIELMLDDRDVDLVKEGIDLAIRIAVLPDSSLIATPLVNSRIVVVAATDYFKQFGLPHTIEELESHQWILSTHYPARLQYEHNGSQYEINIKGKIKVNNEQARLNLTLDGHGIAFMPAYEAWDAIQDGRLQEVPFDTHAPILPITALYHNRKYLPQKITTFIDYLKQYLANQLWIS